MSPRLPHPKARQVAPLLATPVGGGAADDDALRLVVEAGTVLESFLDQEAALGRIARLAVPRLADWCALDLADGTPELKPVAVAHTDPEAGPLLHEIAEKYPSRLDSPFGIGKVARTGERELIPVVNDATLAVIAQYPDQLTLWRTLGMRARLILPLRWGDSVLGTLLLAQGDSGRRFDDRAIVVAEDLARRIALALVGSRAAHDASESHAVLAATQRELRMAQERLEDTQRELTLECRHADAARQQAEEASQAKGQFLARMSHELRTPLNAIGGYTQLLEMGVRGPITAEQREDLLRIQRSQRQLLSLINDVLNLAKLETGRVSFEIVPMRVAQIVGEIEALIEPQVQAKRQRLELVGVDSTVEALGDREKTQQILLNLLSNAIKFTSEGGRLRVFIESDAQTVRAGVQDSGIGMPPEKLEKVFEPFIMLSHPLAGDQQGTGLGLAISRDLAQGMGGELVAQSEPGVGSTFTLVLRRTVPDAARTRPVYAPTPLPAPDAPAL